MWAGPSGTGLCAHGQLQEHLDLDTMSESAGRQLCINSAALTAGQAEIPNHGANMSRDEKNSAAYEDCANFAEPSYPGDPEFMEFYRYWRAIARFPGDECELDFRA